jgi:Leucine-rich repeat (LRR) protein
LSLARNKLTKLVPRLFYRLEKLEFLDLSGNPLIEIEPDDVKDLKPLRQLYLVGCQLTKLHSLIYQSLPNLEELDLRDNQFETLASNEFKYLKKLNNLYLNGNKLTVIVENTFNGLRLNKVSLSRNFINLFKLCAFCNSTIKELDISFNKFTEFQTDIIEPLSKTLISLNVDNNFDLQDSPTSVSNLIRPLKRLRKLSLSSMSLDDNLPSNTFLNQRETLSSIDLSGNKFVNISAKLFEGLKRLEVLDLSSNSMYAISESVLETLNSLPTLTLLYLDSNPWSCYRCHILPLMEWIHTSPPAYVNACQKDEKHSCAKCVHPQDLVGKELHSMEEWHLVSFQFFHLLLD